MSATASQLDVRARAERSLGASGSAIYDMVARELEARHAGGGTIVDVGCGAGHFHAFAASRCDRYVGADVLRYPGFPESAEFVEVDLDSGRVPIEDGSADIVTAIEVIEHLENPRAFVRELVRMVRPGGWVLVTTPNQQSLLSLFTLVVKGSFSAFQDSDYPAHITALLEVDLKRIATETGLEEVGVRHSLRGRVVLTPYHYPRALARIAPRVFSDNVLLFGRKRRG